MKLSPSVNFLATNLSVSSSSTTGMENFMTVSHSSTLRGVTWKTVWKTKHKKVNECPYFSKNKYDEDASCKKQKSHPRHESINIYDSGEEKPLHRTLWDKQTFFFIQVKYEHLLVMINVYTNTDRSCMFWFHKLQQPFLILGK